MSRITNTSLILRSQIPAQPLALKTVVADDYSNLGKPAAKKSKRIPTMAAQMRRKAICDLKPLNPRQERSGFHPSLVQNLPINHGPIDITSRFENMMQQHTYTEVVIVDSLTGEMRIAERCSADQLGLHEFQMYRHRFGYYLEWNPNLVSDRASDIDRVLHSWAPDAGGEYQYSQSYFEFKRPVELRQGAETLLDQRLRLRLKNSFNSLRQITAMQRVRLKNMTLRLKNLVAPSFASNYPYILIDPYSGSAEHYVNNPNVIPPEHLLLVYGADGSLNLFKATSARYRVWTVRNKGKESFLHYERTGRPGVEPGQRVQVFAADKGIQFTVPKIGVRLKKYQTRSLNVDLQEALSELMQEGETRILIGRDESCDIVVDSKYYGDFHAVISFEEDSSGEGAWFIEDVGDGEIDTGVFVKADGASKYQRIGMDGFEIKFGDKIAFGDEYIHFKEAKNENYYSTVIDGLPLTVINSFLYYGIALDEAWEGLKATKKLFRKEVRLYHPDRNRDDKNADVLFKKATEAYDVVSFIFKYAEENDLLGNTPAQIWGLMLSRGEAGKLERAA